MEYKLGQVGIIGKGKLLLGTMYMLSAVQQLFFFFFNIMNKYVWFFLLGMSLSRSPSIQCGWVTTSRLSGRKSGVRMKKMRQTLRHPPPHLYLL